MIDTFQMYYKPIEKDIKAIKEYFKPHKCNKRFIWTLQPIEGISMKYYLDFNLLQIVVTPAVVLNKQYVFDEDYVSIVTAIDKVLSSYLGRLCFSDLKLSRIDYKLDIKTPYKDIYVGILKKLRYCYRRRYRNNYATSTYYKGRNYNLNLYDKEAKEVLGLHWREYTDLLRLEIQLKSRHLQKLSRNKNYGLQVCLKNYFSDVMRKCMFEDVLLPLLYRGDYYTTRKSRFILEKCSYTNSMVTKLIHFQKLVYEHGITGAIKKSDKSDNTIRSYITKLQNAGVNPMPLPKDCRVNYLPNLLSFFRFTE